jgi:plasmid stabilization system protein ParE
MSRTIRVRPEAERDVEAAFAWYEEQRAGLGREFLEELDVVYERVALFPFMCAVLYCDKMLADAEVENLIAALEQHGVLSLAGAKVTYRFAQAAEQGHPSQHPQHPQRPPLGASAEAPALEKSDRSPGFGASTI